MIFDKFVCFSVSFVFLVCIQLCFSQADVLLDQGAETVTQDQDPPSDTICTLCSCDNGVVDCTNRNISAPFELTDWDGLQSFQPKKVDLSQNLLTEVTRISKLPIEVLNMSNCDISTLEDASFIYLAQLVSLDLSRNNIATSAITRRTFCGPLDASGPQPFKRMTTISLAYNDIHSLPQDVFGFFPGLTTLDLSGNPLAYIDQVTMGAISELQYLRVLKLSGCELETLPDGLLRRQRKLRKLDISDNRFTTIPSVLQEAPYLTYLNFDKNSVQIIDSKIFANLTKLQELSISRMSRLHTISANALGGMFNLITLRITHNPRLTTLDPAFLVWEDEDGEDQWPDLQQIYLNNNNLTTIDSHFLDGWQDLKAADFTSNPYVCDCSSQWMVDVLVPLLNNGLGNGTASSMVCKKPADVKGMTFQQLADSSKTLVCNSIAMIESPGPNMAILLGIMIGIFVTFPLVLILVLLWRKGYFSKFRSRKNVDEYDDEEAENL